MGGISMQAEAEYDARRLRRWRWFQVIFAWAYAGVVLDIVTTALGVQKDGKAYEQNPLGSLLIGNAGWIGLFLLVSGLAAVCYFSTRLVCFRMSLRWTTVLAALLVVAGLVRWLAVVTAVLYLA